MFNRIRNSIRNVFTRIIEREQETDTKLGMPLTGAARQRRLDTMSRMTGGNGFTVPAKTPEKDSQGKTRGERKRALRVAAMAKVSEDRAPEFMHSSARVRAGFQAPSRPMTGFLAGMKVAA